MNVNLNKIRKIWHRLQASFWFMPAVLAAAAMILAVAAIAVDAVWLFREGFQPWLIYSGGPDGAGRVLSVIAGSMMTVAGVVFSITIVVLSLASSQFGPRLIRNFMEVKSNQVVLGSFVATFIYSIVVLHSVNATAEGRFVPRLSVSIGIVLSLVSLGLLIYFIHNISNSIRAENIIARIRHDLAKAVDRLYPEDATGGKAISRPIERDYVIPTHCDGDACPVRSEQSGYIQMIDAETLVQIAVDENLLLHLAYRPGNFITGGSTLVTVWPGQRVDEALSKRIHSAFILGSERTLEQDVEFAISLLVEIAVRALSPGVNDPITAITCIDWLGVSLCQVASRRMPASHCFDQNNRLRLIRKTFHFDGMVDAAFNKIRQHAETDAAVSIRLLETIAAIGAQTSRLDDQRTLQRHAAMVFGGCRHKLSLDEDRRDLEERYNTAIEALGAKPDEKAKALAV